jgi:hypothetical protein
MYVCNVTLECKLGWRLNHPFPASPPTADELNIIDAITVPPKKGRKTKKAKWNH